MAIINALAYSIANGQPIDAVPVQSNFAQIVSDVNTNAAPINSPSFTGPVDSNGIITNSGATQPAFGYYLGVSDTTGLANTNTVFGTALFTQQGTAYNAATGVFTVATAGLYWITARLTISNTTGGALSRSFNLIRNGVSYMAAEIYLPNAINADALLSTIIRCAAADTISIQPTWNRIATNAVLASTSSNFQAYLLG